MRTYSRRLVWDLAVLAVIGGGAHSMEELSRHLPARRQVAGALHRIRDCGWVEDVQIGHEIEVHPTETGWRVLGFDAIYQHKERALADARAQTARSEFLAEELRACNRAIAKLRKHHRDHYGHDPLHDIDDTLAMPKVTS